MQCNFLYLINLIVSNLAGISQKVFKFLQLNKLLPEIEFFKTKTANNKAFITVKKTEPILINSLLLLVIAFFQILLRRDHPLVMI